MLQLQFRVQWIAFLEVGNPNRELSKYQELSEYHELHHKLLSC